MTVNLYSGWIGLLLGCVAGILPGLFFHAEHWLGGYAAWPRRMIRLAHISFFGIGFLNLAFALTAQTLGFESGLLPPSVLLIVGAVTMPLVCYLAAWKTTFRHLFLIPASSVTLAVALFLWRMMPV